MHKVKFLYVLALLSCSCCLLATVTGSSYYVAAPDGAPCPNNTSTSCQELSFYTNQSSVYFTNNTVFYFLEGHHFLEQNFVIIAGINNLTLQGLGIIEPGPHETVMQSTVVIHCKEGFAFLQTQFVTIEAITLNGCTGHLYNFDNVLLTSGLAIVLSQNFHLQYFSVQNSTGYGLAVLNSFNLTIKDSSFYRNEIPRAECTYFNCLGGNALIIFSDEFLTSETVSSLTNNSKINILKSNFSLSFGRQYQIGSGLMIEIKNQKFDYRVDINIHNVVTYGNSGSYGANIHAAVTSNVAHYRIDINNTLSLYGNTINPLDLNDELAVGAGLYFIHNCSVFVEATLLIYNSNFSHNEATSGAGAFLYWANYTQGYIIMNQCTFFNNSADGSSALHVLGTNIASFRNALQTLAMTNVNVDNCKPRNKSLNSNLQSAITLQEVIECQIIDISITNCLGTGLIAFTTSLIFRGENNIFYNNTGIDGGGMAMYGTSNILFANGIIYYIANHALHNGGGLYVSQSTTPTTSLCFFLVIALPAKVLMSRNTASVAGSALYGGSHLQTCMSVIPFASVFSYNIDQPGQSVISSDPIKVCLCTEMNEVNCNVTEYFTSTIPGREYSIPVCTVGNLDGLTPGVIAVKNSLTNNLTLEDTAAECRTLSFTLATTDVNLTKVTIALSLQSFSEIVTESQSRVIATITIQQCLFGFSLNTSSGICDCSDQLRSIPGVTCDIVSETISRQTGGWIGYNNDTNCTLTSNTCPLDFCQQGSVTFTMNDPDIQCAMNRSGVLCGGCAEGLSLLLGSNKCGQCSNAYLTLLLPFALAGIALVAILIALNLTVSVGAINGLIFYANIVKIQESFFFPNGPIPVLSQFISWINLDLGIEVCFFDGLTSCTKAWFQFLFPLYVWLILILIIILARFSEHLLRLVGSQIVPVLATLLLLSYTKLIRSVIQALYITEILNCKEQHHAVWFIDGNIRYFTGCHLPLVIVASAVLLFLILPYTLFLLASPAMEAYLTGYKCFRWVVKLKPVLDAYGGPYHDKYRVWTGVLVLVRLVLALITSLSDSVSISISALMGVAVLLITIHCIAQQVYKKWQFSVLEVVFLLNLILLGYTVNRLNSFLPERIGIIILLSFSLIIFLGILFYHILLRLKLESKLNPQTLRRKFLSTFKNNKTSAVVNGDDVVTVHTHRPEPSDRYRESLLLNSDFHEFIDDN